jgi:hypothetical protein
VQFLICSERSRAQIFSRRLLPILVDEFGEDCGDGVVVTLLAQAREVLGPGAFTRGHLLVDLHRVEIGHRTPIAVQTIPYDVEAGRAVEISNDEIVADVIGRTYSPPVGLVDGGAVDITAGVTSSIFVQIKCPL